MAKSDTQFEIFLQVIESNHIHKTAIQSAYKKYDLHYSDLARLSPTDIRKLRETLIQKQNNQEDFRFKLQEEWIECERKLFVWVLICFLSYHKKQIEKLEEDDFQHLSNLTTHKSIPLIKYMALSLIKSNKRPIWTPEQDEILLNLLAVEKKHKTAGEWSVISRQLFLKGNQESIKTAKNCRQRWFNHIDPKICKEWTTADDVTMLYYIKDHGKKWAKIAMQLNNTKSQHMVKNRYNSLLRRVEKERGNLKENELMTILLDNIKEEGKQTEIKLQKVEKKEAPKTVIKQEIKVQSKNIAVIRPTTVLKDEDQENQIRMIYSKNYSPECDIVERSFGLDDSLKFYPSSIFRQVKEDMIQQIIQESGDQKPKRGQGKNDIKLNQSYYFGNPSPKAPTPQPLFFQSPLPQEINGINGSFYNFSKFMTSNQ